MAPLAKNIISLSGHIGSGKSEVSRFLSESLGFSVESTGKIQREIAAKMDLSPLDLNRVSMSDRKFDDLLDNFLRELDRSGEKLIVDSRLAWHFIPNSFKVFITVDPKIAAERVFHAKRGDEKYTSLEETLQSNLNRQKLENERFLNLYEIDCSNLENYDLVLDSSHESARQIAAKIAESFRNRSPHPI